MEKKQIRKYIIFMVVLYIASLVVGVAISINNGLPIEDLEMVADITEDKDFYLMKTGSKDTSVIKVNCKGEIVGRNVEKVSSYFSKYISEYEGSVLTANNGAIYCVKRLIDNETMQVVQRDIVKLDASNLHKKPIIVHSYKGNSTVLPRITGLACKDDNLYVALVAQNGEKAYIDKLNMTMGAEFAEFKRIKSISAPIGDSFNNILPNSVGEMFALTKGGRVYFYDNKYDFNMIYPSSVVDDKFASLISVDKYDNVIFYTQEEAFKYYNKEKNEISSYNSEALRKKSVFSKELDELVYFVFNDNSDIFILSTLATPTDDECKISLHIVGDGNFINLKTIKNSKKLMVYDSLKKSAKIFEVCLLIAFALWLVVYIIENSKKVIYKFILVIIPILIIAFGILGYKQSNNDKKIMQDLKVANAITVNHAIIGNIDSSLVRELRDSREAYWNGAYTSLYNQIQISGNNKNNFKDISKEVLSDNKVAGVDENYIYNEIFLIKDGEIFTGVSNKTGYMLQMGTEYFEGTEALFNEVKEKCVPVLGSISSKIYRGGVYVTPIKDGNEIVGLLSTTFDTYTITKFVSDEVKFFARIALFLIIGISLPVYIMFAVVLKPIKELEKAVTRLADGDYSVKLVSTSNDEFSYIRNAFNKMSDQLNGSIYRVNNISNSYFRFVPRQIFSILNKKDILDVQLGDKRSMEGVFLTHMLYNFTDIKMKIMAEGGDNLSDIIKFVNKYFSIVYSGLKRYNGSLLSNDLKLNKIEMVFLKGERAAIEYAIGIIKQLTTEERLNEFVALNTAIIIYRVNILYGIVGEQERAFPFVLSEKKEQIDDILLDFKLSGAKLIITDEIKKAVEDWKELTTRYIGYSCINNKKTRVAMYEVLDCCDIASKQQKESTAQMFQNALNLFYKGEFYLARNEFSNVVKRSPLDNIARWYLFVSDKYCNKELKDYNFEIYGNKDVKIM